METLEYTMWELGIDNLVFSAFRHDPYIAWMFFISFKSYFILFLLHISQLVQYFDASVYKQSLTVKNVIYSKYNM